MRQSAEDYLEVILILKNRLGLVHSIDVANELGFSRPSVSNAIKKLRENGYITFDDNHIELTESGRKIAEDIYERHNLIANFLMSVGVTETVAFEDACKIEHDLSEESFAAMKRHFLETKGGK